VKLTLLDPLASVTLVMFVVPLTSRKCTPDGAVELVAKFTVWALVAVATLLYGSSSCTVIVPEITPAVSVCAVVAYTSWLAVAAFTVSACVADVNGLSDAVNNGLPASVSSYLKLTLLAPLAIVTLVTFVVPLAFRKCTPDGAVELVVRFTVCALPAVATLLYGSSSCTVIVLEITPAVSVCAVVVYTNLLAAAAFTVSTCVAVTLDSALSVAVKTGFSTSVSLYLKLTLLAPLAMIALVMLVVLPASRKWTPDGAVELVASSTVCK
jgi:hypothetical protein